MLRWFIRKNRSMCAAFNERFPALVRDDHYRRALLDLLDGFVAKRPFTHVLEVGGGDRPLLRKSPNISYDGLDTTTSETRDRAYDRFFVQSIETPVEGRYDLIASIMVLEHVPDNRASMQSCRDALNEGGAMMHYVPSKWHPYAIILRLVSPGLQKRIIALLRPDAVAVSGHPAHFDRCSPGEMRRTLEHAGFEGIRIRPFYNATDYFGFFFPLYLAVLAWENLCSALGLEWPCSGFIFIAFKSGKRP